MSRMRWLALCCAAVMGLMVCLPALAEGGAGEGGDVSLESYEIASAEYPEMPRNPFIPDPAAAEMTDDAFDAAFNAWMDAQQARGEVPIANPDGLNDFFARSARTLLADVESENAAWSALSYREKNWVLFLRQKSTLDAFLSRGAISRAQHDRSLRHLAEKMGVLEEVVVHGR